MLQLATYLRPEVSIRQQWGVVHSGTPPLKTENSNNPPSKISGGSGRYPSPKWSGKMGPPLARGARRKFFFVFLCSKKIFGYVFFKKNSRTMGVPWVSPPVEIFDPWFEPPLYRKTPC